MKGQRGQAQGGGSSELAPSEVRRLVLADRDPERRRAWGSALEIGRAHV